MLQINKPLLSAFCLFVMLAGTGAWANDGVDWLLEDALKEDNVSLIQTDVVSPAEYSQALNYYKKGNFRYAVHSLEKLKNINLPDSRLDFLYFASAECYRQLNLGALAAAHYRFIIDHCKESEKVAPSYFRLLHYACDSRDITGADSITAIFEQRFKNHPLYASALYACGRLYYKEKKWVEATKLLSLIPANSALYIKAQFLNGICFFQNKEPDKALFVLDYVRKNAFAGSLEAEANIVIADIYYDQEKYDAALTYYGYVDRAAKRYPYSLIKTARSLLELKQFDKARDCAKRFIAKNKTGDYYFEMLSVLEQVYGRLQDHANQERIKTLIFNQFKSVRYSFEVYQELGRSAEMISQWEAIEATAARKKDEPTRKVARENIDRCTALKNKLAALADLSGNGSDEGGGGEVTGAKVRKYLEILKNQMIPLQDTIKILQTSLDAANAGAYRLKPDSAILAKVKKLDGFLETYKNKHNALNREYALVLKECLGGNRGQSSQDNEMLAKFVDWAFLRYQDKKRELTKMNTELAAKNAAKTGKALTDKKTSDVTKLFSQRDIDKADNAVVEERTTLIGQIKAMQYVYPKSKFTAGILFRLAELYYDRASDAFDVKLRDYEKKMAEGKTGITFPEFDVGDVVEAYDRIITNYPKDDMADDAYFYKALALQKMGKYDFANDALVALTKNYPESEYYVEANMNIARYYFEHPKIDGGKGYKLAEETYHKVLYYRDHPQFVSALYSLGWCYYMQDKFDEAIAVFKYLVEEVALDFDVTKMDDKKQVMNPLLRDEAIDYIAISFDEENRMDDAVKFLTLIGNIDYAATVLRRIAELREEDMDYPAAIHAYERLLTEYPQSIAAPEASLGIIKMYELQGKREDAKKQREEFFKVYAKGGQWQELVWKRDSLFIPRIDSIAISMGQFIADESFRVAEATNDTAAYSKAAQCYRIIVKAYSDKPRSLDAQWNLAVILDNKLNQGADAYIEYIKFSQNTAGDAVRREQAALNAIALAQKMMPPDTAVREGVMEPASYKVVDAVNNYKGLFPKGKNLGGALLSMGAIYFNRKMYAKAAEYYDLIIGKGVENEETYEALFWLGQCHYGKENWEAASKCFDKVWKNSSGTRKTLAYKLLLQSEFARAKQAFAAGAFKDAAQIFLSIESRYPGSEYGDVVLFKAAESYEKTEKWLDACDGYFRLVRNYPLSKLAPNALFNAAMDYEKANKYDKAAEAYELLTSNYPESDRTKDALFNLGLCYEKAGNLDKVAEANERYTKMFPGEKDVEAMLLRTAQYYAKANLHGKAVTVYRNFIRQYPQSPKTVEALFMIGKSFLDRKDRENAITNFSQAEQQHIKFVTAGAPGNTYYAAEAAFALASMKREDFAAIKFSLPEAKFKADQKTKTALLLDAAKAFEHVIQYQSDKMFESAYWIGEMYEDMAEAWKTQERPKLDPIKLAVFEKDIALFSSTLLQKSFVPYKKVIEMSLKFDSLTTEQKTWVYKTKVALAKNYSIAGALMFDGVVAMQNAPIPSEIKNKPLYNYQYQKQLIETIEPMKVQTRHYYMWAYKQLDSMKLIGENSKKCIDECMRVNFILGNDYDKLAEKILRDPELPKELTVAEKEELTFQLEDVVYELQDKAIANYEEALRMLGKENLSQNEYNGKIIQALARLSPDTWGKKFFQRSIIASSKAWKVRPDSIAGWNSKRVPDGGWKNAGEVPPTKPATFPFGNPMYIWQDSTNAASAYFWKHLFFEGQPRDAAIHFALEGKYWLYVNGTLMSSDTTGKRQADKRDSITGISKMFKGGDNELSLHVVSLDSLSRGVAMALSVMMDTTQRFTQAGEKGASGQASQPVTASGAGSFEKDQSKGLFGTSALAGKTSSASLSYDHEFKNRGELLNAITEYQAKAQTFGQDIKKERLSIQKLQLKTEDTDLEIQRVKDEIATLKKSMVDMKRTK